MHPVELVTHFSDYRAPYDDDDVQSTTSTLSAKAGDALDSIYGPRSHSLEYQHVISSLLSMRFVRSL